MKLSKIICSVITVAALQSIAFAGSDQCNKYSSSYERTYCMCKLFIESDKDLNDVYGKLRKKLNKSGQTALKNAELRWLKFRTSQCEDSPGSIDVECSYNVNVERTNFLRERLYECNSGMCDYDAIGNDTW